MEKKLGGMQSGLTFLDVGCSIGLVVKAALQKGFHAYGIDINEKSIDKGIELFDDLIENHDTTDDNKLMLPRLVKGDFAERYKDDANRFDILACNQTLEHISNPVEFLNVCKKVLNNNGLLFIDCPSFDEEDARNKWHRWQTMGKGEYTWIPTNKSFDYLMLETGFEYEHLQDTGKGIFVKAWKK